MASDLLQQHLLHILQKHADPLAVKWLQEQFEKIENSFNERPLFMAFGASARKFAANAPHYTDTELQKAGELGNGFSIAHWNMQEIARACLFLRLAGHPKEQYLGAMHKLFGAADVAEQVALYKALPILPYPEDMVTQAAEGVRTNMTVVLDAVALHNPFPQQHFNQTAWNQMVLKSIFTERPLYQIWGLDARANPELTQMLIDYAHERRAAGRYVVPELWRAALPYLTDTHTPELLPLLEGDSLFEQAAAALCLQELKGAQSDRLRKEHAETQQQALAKYPDWDSLGKAYSFAMGTETGYQQAGSGRSISK